MAGTRKNSAPQTEGKTARSKGSTVKGAGGAAVAPGIDLELIRGLIAAVDESGIDSLEIARAGTRIRISKTAPVVATATTPSTAVHAPVAASVLPVAPARDPAEAASEAALIADQERASRLHDIKSPMVGTFYRAPAPEAPAYVELGSTVSVGQTLCILEAMKLMNELESEVEGVVREILVENADPVEFGQVLFRVEKTGAGS